MLNNFFDIANDTKQRMKNFSVIDEELSLHKLDYMIINAIPNVKDRGLFRFLYKTKDNNMFVNMFETPHKNWEFSKKLEANEMMRENMNDCEQDNFNVFLKRNLLKKRKYDEWKSSNNIKYHVISSIIIFNKKNKKFEDNCLKLINSSHQNEDFLIHSQIKSNKDCVLNLKTEFNKTAKFNVFKNGKLINLFLGLVK